MKLYYDSNQRVLYIDRKATTTTLSLPNDLSEKDMRKFIQSETLYEIIKQIKGDG